jgi:NADPH2:quinone reductase
MRAIQISEFGGPEVLQLVELPTPVAAADQVLIEVSAAGLNFADTHARANQYVAKYELPLIPGSEVAGIRAGTGERVVALTGTGGYAEFALAPRDRVWPIPDGVSDGEALALLIQGMTAWHLYATAGRVTPGESVVVHGAAGGVGSLAVQLGAAFEAGRVIATASSPEKREIALQLGAHAALDPASDGLTQRLIEANGGKPVDVVFEMSGGAVFDASLTALAPFGRVIAYGIASREQNEIRSGKLMKNSWSVIGFWFFHCFAKPEAMVARPLRELYGLCAERRLQPLVGATYALSDAAQAQIDLAERRTTGKLLLDVSR